MDWQEKLIALFSYIYKNYESELFICSERMSNNSDPKFSDTEMITVYLWGIMNGHKKVKSIYKYTRNHLSEWFPRLPSYATYIQRLNRISPVFSGLLPQIQNDFPQPSGPGFIRLIQQF